MLLRGSRQALTLLTWLLVAGVVVQVFLAGVGLFEVASMDFHRYLGYWLPLLPLLMLLACVAARPGRAMVAMCATLFVLLGMQSILILFREVAPVVAALHPPNALMIFALSIVTARRSERLMREATASG